MVPVHYSVLYREVLEFLTPEKEDAFFLDGTLGEGGHSFRMLERWQHLKLIGLDADSVMLDRARERLACFSNRIDLHCGWFDQFLGDYPRGLLRPEIMLFDLGISLYHYEGIGRGFSFRENEKLDMRLNPDLELSAYEVVNHYSQEQLQGIFSQYGEERYSGRIAKAIVDSRQKESIRSSLSLAEIVRESVPKKERYGRVHPATRVFQAIRIEVNHELDRLRQMLLDGWKVLVPGGKMAVITFHSLEDREVKLFFREKHRQGRVSVNKYGDNKAILGPEGELLFKRPIEAGEQELLENPPSRSARLRIIRKLREA